MRDTPACPLEDHLRAIALARLILPFDVHLQAPPNLTDTEQLGTLLGAGIDDWGGVSPVTADHVNPERPWPALRTLRSATEDAQHALVPRLTIYPEFALDPAVAGPGDAVPVYPGLDGCARVPPLSGPIGHPAGGSVGRDGR